MIIHDTMARKCRLVQSSVRVTIVIGKATVGVLLSLQHIKDTDNYSYLIFLQSGNNNNKSIPIQSTARSDFRK